MKKLLFLFTFLFFIIPVFVFAQGSTTFSDFIFGPVSTLIRYLIYIVLALALVVFLWGLAKFILKAESAEERNKGRQLMIWGLIGLFVMFSVTGLVYFIREAIFDGGSQFGVPHVYLEEDSDLI